MFGGWSKLLGPKVAQILLDGMMTQLWLSKQRVLRAMKNYGCTCWVSIHSTLSHSP